MSDQIYIFDTTLRDGEQTPGVCFSADDKLEIAKALAALKVDIIEAGFPIASPGDFAGVKRIADTIKGPSIAALARANQKDIDAAYAAIKGNGRPRIHTFLATSDIHLEYKLKMTRQEALEQAERAVRYAKNLVHDVEFSAEDASRSDWDYLCQVFTRAIAAGATVINIPDTVGYMVPEEYTKLIAYVHDHVPNMDQAMISVHCHDDLGMAVANSLAGVHGGAMQIECAVNGIGERAGNASLEELVMALYTRKDAYKLQTGIETRQIYKTSRLVSTLSGIAIPPNKAVIGDNAFAHESGIHQHGVLSNASTYEIMEPEMIGISRNAIVLGKHSGRHAFEARLNQLGYDLTAERINELFDKFKELADRKKVIFDKDLEALVHEKVQSSPEHFRLLSHQVISGTQAMATATVRLESKTETIEKASSGDGPVDALFNAITDCVDLEITLKDYQLKAVTSGKDALGEATVWLECDGKVVSARGVSTDVIEASAKAYVQAVNKLMTETQQKDEGECVNA